MKMALGNPLFCMQKNFYVKNNFLNFFPRLFHSFAHVPKLQYKKKTLGVVEISLEKH